MASSPKRTALAALLALGATSLASAQVTYTGGTYSENFDSLSLTSVTGAFPIPIGTQAAIPGLPTWAGSKIQQAGTSTTVAANFTADAGTAVSGALYSYGAAGIAERALGALASGSQTMAFGTQIVNSTGGTITSVTIGFRAEFWRSSTSSTATPNRLTFAYATNGGTADATNYLSNAGMTALPALDVVGPTPVATNGALDGNLPANQAIVAPVTITGLSIAPGGSLFIRWSDFNDQGNDAGLAIDDLTFTATVSTGGDVSRGAGTTFTPSSFGGNAFTANDNAVFDGSSATVNLSGAVAATALKFKTKGYTLAGTPGNTIAITGSITTDDGVDATISGEITGANALTKIGPGTLTLSGANTFTGNVTVAAGTLTATGDASFGNAANDIVLGGTLQLPGGTSLGAGRDLTGTGSITLIPAGSLAIGGSIPSGSITFASALALSLAGTTNTPGTLTFNDPLTLSITGGALAPTGGFVFNQTSGTTTISGPINVTATGDRTFTVAGGTVKPTGQFGIGTGRYIKTGLGTLDLTGTTLTTSSTTAGGIRFGVQGATPADGGTLIVDEATDLGNGQFQFNSGTFAPTTSLTFPVGVSIGGRLGGAVSTPTLDGADVTFNGTSGFFAAAGASGDIGVVLNKNLTLGGTVAITTAPTVAAPVPPLNWIDISGTGTLAVNGDGSAVIDKFYVHGGAKLAINGSLGGTTLQIGSGSTLAGAGTFSGYYINPATYPTVTTLQPYAPSNVTFDSGSILAPTGALTLRASVAFDPGTNTYLDINGTTAGTYDSVAVDIVPGSGLTNTLAQAGTLTINFTVTPTGTVTYPLFPITASVTRSGDFGAVFITGAYTLPLAGSAGVWTGTSGGTNFSFNSTTGVLTVTASTPAPVITSSLTASGVAGTAFSYTIAALNSPTSFSTGTSALPAGLTLNTSTGVIDGNPSVSGVFPVTISATNAGGTDTETLVITILSRVENWRLTNFGSAANTGNGADTADIDGDGIANLVEYALGTSPTVANANPLAVATTVVSGSTYLTATFPRVNDPTLTYAIESTSALPSGFTASGFTVPGGTTSATYTDTVAITAGATRYVRLVVTY